VALTLFVIPAFLLGARHSATSTIAASGCIWIISQFYSFGPAWTNFFPFFNPLAWQFLFSIGMYFGIQYRSGPQQAQWTAKANRLLVFAWAVVTISLLYRFLPFLAKMVHLDVSWFHPYEPLDDQYKYNLSAVRLVHFLCVAFLVRYYVSPKNPALRWADGCIIKTGKWSLQIFSIGAVLSVAGTIVFATCSPSLLGKLALNAGVILLTALTAMALSNYKKRNGSIDAIPDSAKAPVLPRFRL
jgi:hypothetical protein